MSHRHVIRPSTPVVGKSICLRYAEPSDAEFILSLRSDEQLNRFISKTTADIDNQVAWLAGYKERERAGSEHYFIIELRDGTPVGTVRIYDYRGDSFCWGSWLIRSDAPSHVAIESALNVYEFAFYSLGFKQSHFDVRRANERVVAFHQRFGAQITHSDDLDHFFIYGRDAYERVRTKYRKFLPLQHAAS
ncbi:GNAT family N-acetyltransferase [Paraburkholderia sediminicola]|uniref:GNAT family N-acetyltransferase n=1 Tax=Paraburkholderia sediminicola TaxID=458836 RepID=UPI0038BAAF68